MYCFLGNCTYIQEAPGTISALLVGSAHGLIVIKGDSREEKDRSFTVWESTGSEVLVDTVG